MTYDRLMKETPLQSHIQQDDFFCSRCSPGPEGWWVERNEKCRRWADLVAIFPWARVCVFCSAFLTLVVVVVVEKIGFEIRRRREVCCLKTRVVFGKR